MAGKSFVAVARDPNGKQKWTTIGNAAHLSIDTAREKAREIITRVKGGQRVEGPQSFESVSKDWLKRHVEAKGLITATDIRRILDSHVLPAWGGRDFASLGRGDISELMDGVADKSGPCAADRVLTTIGSIFSWYAVRNDNYNSPIVRGMRRISKKERARDRILSDDEIRLVWSKAEGTFGDLVKMLLLTAQRRDKVVSMRWDEIANGTWSVANGNPRAKGTGGDLILPKLALDTLNSRPRFASNPYVFPGTGQSHYKSYAGGKIALDKATGELPRWTLHDLRRTARSLMSRAGVLPHIAEQVLGHAQPGVAGIYDRHAYRDEKAQALKMLAGLIDNILRGDTGKVVKLRG